MLAAIEGAFAGVRRFELFTGDRSLKNLGFYRRRGYTEYRREPEPGHAILVFLEKPAR